jgi:hypothetical protein
MGQLVIWLRACCAWESLLLFTMCVADMTSTLFFIHNQMATEANPVMASMLNQSDFMFCFTKTLSFLPFLLIAAYYRPRRPRMITVALRGTVVLYALVYGVAVGGQVLCQ